VSASQLQGWAFKASRSESPKLSFGVPPSRLGKKQTSGFGLPRISVTKIKFTKTIAVVQAAVAYKSLPRLLFIQGIHPPWRKRR